MKHITSINFSDNKGFSLAEVIVVCAIIGLISTAIITNFSRSRINLAESTTVVSSTIRSAQSNAISSTRYNNYVPCGYGFHYIDPTHFAVYVAPSASANTCSTLNHNYSSDKDTLLTTVAFNNDQVQFMAPFNDIYFEPPDPKTYLNNVYNLSQSKETVTIGVKGTTCPTNCTSIYVYPSGIIDTQ